MDTILTKTKHPLMTRDYCGGGNYSGGALMGGGTVNNPGIQPYKYGTKELDRQNGLDWYDSQARMYDPLLGRTTTMDPKAEEYYPISPYAWCAANPSLFTDLDGKKINMKPFLDFERVNNMLYSPYIMQDLSFETGLEITINEKTNRLEYKTDEEGKAIISIDEKGEEMGSAKAREQLIKMIDSEETVTISGTIKGGTKTYGNSISLDVTQISSFIAGAANVDCRTLGFGMTFLHESFHTVVGGALKDSRFFYSRGEVVNNMNIIREELNIKGFNFGQRMHYIAEPINGKFYIGFDRTSAGLIHRELKPTKSKFISF